MVIPEGHGVRRQFFWSGIGGKIGKVLAIIGEASKKKSNRQTSSSFSPSVGSVLNRSRSQRWMVYYLRTGSIKREAARNLPPLVLQRGTAPSMACYVLKVHMKGFLAAVPLLRLINELCSDDARRCVDRRYNPHESGR